MKISKPIITPDMLPHFDLDLDKIDYEQLSSKKYKKEFKKSDAYKKYIQPMLNEEKARKKQFLKDWIWNKGLLIVNTILALIAAVTGVIAILLQLN